LLWVLPRLRPLGFLEKARFFNSPTFSAEDVQIPVSPFFERLWTFGLTLFDPNLVRGALRLET
jgi:hypothetical protein